MPKMWFRQVNHIICNLMGKKEIKSAERDIRHAGKKQSSIEDDRDLGGKPSAYQVTQEFDKLKNVIEKPGAIELLYQKMAASGLAYGLIKYQQLAFLYAVKMDESALPKLLDSIGKMFFPGKLTEEDDFPDSNATHQYLQSLDENRLNAIAEYGTKISLENLHYHQYFVTIFGLMQF
jgi:hypothetical protein